MPKGPAYTGPLTLSAMADEEPVKANAVDMAPYVAAVRASDEKRKEGHEKPGVGFNVPTASVKRQETLFREAAKTVGCGVSVVSFDHTHSRASDWGLTPGESRIIVTARDKKAAPGAKAAEGNGKPASAPTKAAAKTAGNPMAGKK